MSMMKITMLFSPVQNPVNLYWTSKFGSPAVDHTLRGGGWSSPSEDLRTSVRRNLFMLEESVGDNPDSMIGFRCVRDVE